MKTKARPPVKVKKVERLGIVLQSWDRNWGRSADMYLMPNGNVGSSSYWRQISPLAGYLQPVISQRTSCADHRTSLKALTGHTGR